VNRYYVLMRYYGVRVALCISLAFACLLGFAGIASATLIGDSIEYDGHVRSGATAAVETHGLAPAFASSSFATFTVPHTNPTLPAPLTNPAKDLSGSVSDFADALNGQLGYSHLVLNLQGPGGTNAFVNPIDGTLALPIIFDGEFHTNSLPLGKKISIDHIGIESLTNGGTPPFDDPTFSTITGTGSAADHLKVHIELSKNFLAADQDIKIHLYYKTTDIPVPEPSTCVLLVMGAAAMIGVQRRCFA
jgi:hypothetical protein